VKDLAERGVVPKELYHKYDFYKKGFWVCFVYVLWDTFASLGLL